MTVRCSLTLALILVMGACANEKPAKKVTTEKTSASEGLVSNDEVCTSLRTNTISTSGDYGDFVKDLCDLGKLAALRISPYYFKGAGEPDVMVKDTANGNSSNMRLWSSFVSTSDARSYFNMMRLQIDKPSEFDDPTTSGTKFDIDPNITYTRKSGDASSTSYHYLNTKEDVAVEYEATTYFVEIVPNKVYAVTSKVDKGISIVQSFRGVQIINQITGGAEVYSMSDQTYDNQGDHATMVGKAKRSFKEDIARGYRNGAHASDANKYYP